MNRLIVPLILTASLASTTAVTADEPRFIKAWGEQGAEDGQFDFCIGIAIHGQALFVTDHYNNRVQKFDFDGKHLASIPVLPYPGRHRRRRGRKAVHRPFPGERPQQGEIRGSSLRLRREGKFVREFGKTGKGDGELDFAGGVAIGPDGNVYVADQTNRRVQVFDKEGKFLWKFGEYGTQPGQFGGTTNPKSRVGGPQLLVFDHDGNLYATEGMVCRVQKLTKEGKPLLQWGTNKDEPGDFGGKFIDSTGKPAYLEGPIGIAVDADNHIWVSSLNGRIQQFDADGKFLGGIQAGQGTEPGKFSAPHGIALNGAGELFVVDSYNQRIQKFATK